jgi:hypothetical protein
MIIFSYEVNSTWVFFIDTSARSDDMKNKIKCISSKIYRTFKIPHIVSSPTKDFLVDIKPFYFRFLENMRKPIDHETHTIWKIFFIMHPLIYGVTFSKASL